MQVVLCASNWVVVKDCEGSFDPYIFALLRCLPCTSALSLPAFMNAFLSAASVASCIYLWSQLHPEMGSDHPYLTCARWLCLQQLKAEMLILVDVPVQVCCRSSGLLALSEEGTGQQEDMARRFGTGSVDGPW